MKKEVIVMKKEKIIAFLKWLFTPVPGALGYGTRNYFPMV